MLTNTQVNIGLNIAELKIPGKTDLLVVNDLSHGIEHGTIKNSTSHGQNGRELTTSGFLRKASLLLMYFIELQIILNCTYIYITPLLLRLLEEEGRAVVWKIQNCVA